MNGGSKGIVGGSSNLNEPGGARGTENWKSQEEQEDAVSDERFALIFNKDTFRVFLQIEQSYV